MYLRSTTPFSALPLLIRFPARLPCVLAILFVCLLMVAGCTRMPGTGDTTLKPKDMGELEEILVQKPIEVDQFRLRGPFGVSKRDNIRLNYAPKAAIVADLYLSAHPDPGPLLIIVHGYDASKEAHALQGFHLASWGVHTLTVQLPKAGPWLENGRRLAALVRMIRQSPKLLDTRIDMNRIILAGHSFGGVAVSVALSEGVSVTGAVLLDPATKERGMPALLAKIAQPVMVLGADRQVSQTRNRDTFYRYIRRNVFEISMRDASHEDGQYPSQSVVDGAGVDSYVTEEGQVTFVSALTASVLSLSSTGSFQQAWRSFDEGLKSGRFADPKQK